MTMLMMTVLIITIIIKNDDDNEFRIIKMAEVKEIAFLFHNLSAFAKKTTRL